MSIPALGGGGSQALQRALMEVAERALADELALLEGDDPAAGAGAGGTNGAGATATRAQVRRRAAGSAETQAHAQAQTHAQPADEAIVVELADGRMSERLEVAGGWITAARRGPLETRDAPGAGTAPPVDQDELPTAPTAPAAAAATTPETAEPDAAETEAPSIRPAAGSAPSHEPVTLERLVVVLKQTGIDFRDAYQVLREIRAGAPLPPKAELRALWAAADPAAWEERARTRATDPTARPQVEPRQSADTDLGRTPVDDVIRDRSWHRAAGHHDPSNASTVRSVPTLQTVARHTPANQAYVAGLSTAEFQRLVTVLGGTAPEWFWDLRGHRGLRGLAERPAIARLNTTRIAGTRLGAWLLAILGMALLWYVGAHTGTWW